MKIVIASKTAGARSGSGRAKVVYHARLSFANKALCGTEPGKRSAWSEYPRIYDVGETNHHVDEVTCKRCKRVLVNYLTEYGVQVKS